MTFHKHVRRQFCASVGRSLPSLEGLGFHKVFVATSACSRVKSDGLIDGPISYSDMEQLLFRARSAPATI